MPRTKGSENVALPATINWQATSNISREGTGGGAIPDWALTSVRASYDLTQAGDDNAAMVATLADEKTARSVANQLRRAAKELGYGIAVRVQDATLTFQAKEARKRVSKTDTLGADKAE